jgi:hypothetical protein
MTAFHQEMNPSLLAQLPNSPETTPSTVPSNGDVNPYGVAFVPQGFEGNGGALQPGDILVANFNSSTGGEGTGTTIVQIRNGQQLPTPFFQSPAIGLTTALGVLKSGFVIVGNIPGSNNLPTGMGSLQIIDSKGNLVTTLTDSALLDGPWDLTINDHGDTAQVFVSNVLSGTVTRIDLAIPDGHNPIVESETQIASGYAHRTDPNLLALGPTGLAFDAKSDTLYVASTLDNEIFAIPNAATTRRDHGTGKVVVQDPTDLHGPLGLVLAPNGDLIVANGDGNNQDPNHLNELAEFAPSRHGQFRFVAQFQLDNTGAPGGAFGIALSDVKGKITFAAVEDNLNQLDVWTIPAHSDRDGAHDGDSDFAHGHAAGESQFGAKSLSDAELAALFSAFLDSANHHSHNNAG